MPFEGILIIMELEHRNEMEGLTSIVIFEGGEIFVNESNAREKQKNGGNKTKQNVYSRNICTAFWSKKWAKIRARAKHQLGTFYILLLT